MGDGAQGRLRDEARCVSAINERTQVRACGVGDACDGAPFASATLRPCAAHAFYAMLTRRDRPEPRALRLRPRPRSSAHLPDHPGCPRSDRGLAGHAPRLRRRRRPGSAARCHLGRRGRRADHPFGQEPLRANPTPDEPHTFAAYLHALRWDASPRPIRPCSRSRCARASSRRVTSSSRSGRPSRSRGSTSSWPTISAWERPLKPASSSRSCFFASAFSESPRRNEELGTPRVNTTVGAPRLT